MKAAVYYRNGGPEVFEYQDVPKPVCPSDGVLLEVSAISIEGGDLIMREVFPLPQVPHIVGYQCSGIITEVGAEVSDRSIGQAVVAFTSSGSHAEFVAAPAKLTWPVPAGLDMDTASAVPVAWGTAHECLFPFGNLKKGETVLISAGAGALGLAAIQLAKRSGATVFATASDPSKLKRLAEFGVDVAINYAKEDFVEVVRAHTQGEGVDLVIDSVGGKNLAKSIESLNYRGRAITVGLSGRDDERLAPLALWMNCNSLQGVYLFKSMANEYERTHAAIATLLEDIANGVLKVVLDRSFKLSEASAAHAHALSRQAFGRILMHP